jgi:sulfate transport system ATP-binding protein
MTIDVKEVSKSFDRLTAVADVSLRVEDGEVVALLGPSGSGKTTLLRIIAGLTAPDRGRVFIDDRDVTEEDVRHRRIGFVFQHYALFRHMTVFENIGFGPKVSQPRPPAEEIQRRVEELLRLVQLDGLGHRLPSQLSGGQRQRVALARALAIEPKVLLLDEPFGALDAQVRKELRRWLRQLHDELGVTSIFVTHDQGEAMEVADRIVVMNKGVVEQIADPVTLYDEPASPFVFEFIGSSNRFDGKLSAGELTIGTLLRFPAPELAQVAGDAIAYVRPNDFTLAPAGASQGFAGIMRHVSVVGPLVHLQVGVPGGVLEAEIARDTLGNHPLKIGTKVVLVPRRVRVFASAVPSGLTLNAPATNEPQLARSLTSPVQRGG